MILPKLDCGCQSITVIDADLKPILFSFGYRLTLSSTGVHSGARQSILLVGETTIDTHGRATMATSYTVFHCPRDMSILLLCRAEVLTLYVSGVSRYINATADRQSRDCAVIL